MIPKYQPPATIIKHNRLTLREFGVGFRSRYLKLREAHKYGVAVDRGIKSMYNSPLHRQFTPTRHDSMWPGGEGGSMLD